MHQFLQLPWKPINKVASCIASNLGRHARHSPLLPHTSGVSPRPRDALFHCPNDADVVHANPHQFALHVSFLFRRSCQHSSGFSSSLNSRSNSGCTERVLKCGRSCSSPTSSFCSVLSGSATSSASSSSTETTPFVRASARNRQRDSPYPFSSVSFLPWPCSGLLICSGSSEKSPATPSTRIG